MDFNLRILNGLKTIYRLRNSPHHGTPISWCFKPDMIYGVVVEQYGLRTQEFEFSFRNAETWSWDPNGTTIKIFGERYTLDGGKIK